METRLREAAFNIIHCEAADRVRESNDAASTQLSDLTDIHPDDVIRVAERYKVQQWVYANVIPRRTLADRQKRNRPLKPIEADRFWRLAAVLARAENAFGDADKAHSWLHRTMRQFGGQTPLEAAATEPGFFRRPRTTEQDGTWNGRVRCYRLTRENMRT